MEVDRYGEQRPWPGSWPTHMHCGLPGGLSGLHIDTLRKPSWQPLCKLWAAEGSLSFRAHDLFICAQGRCLVTGTAANCLKGIRAWCPCPASWQRQVITEPSGSKESVQAAQPAVELSMLHALSRVLGMCLLSAAVVAIMMEHQPISSCLRFPLDCRCFKPWRQSW